MTYNMKLYPQGITKDQLTEDDGACDCIVVHSILGTPGKGPISMVTLAFNGVTDAPLAPEHIFSVWVLLASQLMDTLPNSWRRKLCRFVFETVREVIVKNKCS